MLRWSRKVIVVLVIALAAELVVASASYVSAADQKNSVITYTNLNYTSDMNNQANVSLKQNMLYGFTSVSNPSTIYNNITKNISILTSYSFISSTPVSAAVYVQTNLTILSGTVPQWTAPLGENSSVLRFEGTSYSGWIAIPFNLNSTLNYVFNTDRQLNLTVGNPTIYFNSTEREFIGGTVAYNHTSLDMKLNYPLIQSSSVSPAQWQYAQITHDPEAWSNVTASFKQVTPLANNRNQFIYTSFASFAAAGAILFVVSIGIRGRSGDEFDRFVRANSASIVRVGSSPQIDGTSIRLEDMAELTKLSELSDQPVFMYDSGTGGLLFMHLNSKIYYYMKEIGQKQYIYRRLKNT